MSSWPARQTSIGTSHMEPRQLLPSWLSQLEGAAMRQILPWKSWTSRPKPRNPRGRPGAVRHCPAPPWLCPAVAARALPGMLGILSQFTASSLTQVLSSSSSDVLLHPPSLLQAHSDGTLQLLSLLFDRRSHSPFIKFDTVEREGSSLGQGCLRLGAQTGERLKSFRSEDGRSCLSLFRV